MLYKQISIFDAVQGQTLALTGLQLAQETAEKQFPGWNDRCWELFVQWINTKPRGYEFLIEDFREYLQGYGLIEMPPSLRSFGFIALKKEGKNLMEKTGYTKKVANKKAHRANASVWRKL